MWTFHRQHLRIAQDLADQTHLDARFVEADVTDAPAAVGHRFVIVFTSRGVLRWLGDLDAWANACANLLKPGGMFYLLDHHPLTMALTPTEGYGRCRGGYRFCPASTARLASSRVADPPTVR